MKTKTFLFILLYITVLTACSSRIKIKGNINTLNKESKEGVWITYVDSTKRTKIFNYKNNLKHGKFIEYHANGTISIYGRYYKGKETGLWKSYMSDGSIRSKKFYYRGRLITNTTYNVAW